MLSFEGRAGEADYRESLHVLEPDGTLRAIGPRYSRQRNPSWIPGRQALLVETSREGFSDIHRLELDGHMVATVSHPSGNYEPNVAPDGKSFAFVSSRSGDAEIYRARIEGDELIRLTFSRGDDTNPSFSPDGSRIAFLSTRHGAARVFVMNTDGSKPRALDDEPTIGQAQLAWSPDGDAVAYVVTRPEAADLRIARVADGAVLARHRGAFRVETPDFSPDGRWVVFASNESGDVELYVMPTTGGEASRVTKSKGVDFLPRWIRSLAK